MHFERGSLRELLAGETLRLSGVVASPVPGSAVATQTREILTRIDRLLAEAGTDKFELILAEIWLRDLATFQEMNAVWDEWITSGRTPHRTTFEDGNLPPPHDVRINIVAALK